MGQRDFRFRFQVLDFKLQIASVRSQGLDFRIEAWGTEGAWLGEPTPRCSPATALKMFFKNPLGLET